MYCYKCGKQIGDDNNFCPYCGAKMKMHDESFQPTSEETTETTSENRDYISDNDIFFGEKISSGERKSARVEIQQQQYSQAPYREAKGMATAGFICAFFIPILGLILSIIAYEKLKKLGAPTKMAVWGIIVAILSLVLSIISNLFTDQLLTYLTNYI